MGRSRLPAAVVAAGVALLCAAPAPSSAYEVGGRPWPVTTVTYRTTARAYAGAVNRAARMINRAGVGVRIRRAASAADADVTVAYGGTPCAGEAMVGFNRWRTDVVTLGRGCGKGLVTLTAVHEFGHVLGLDHENHRCARMNPSFDSSGTPNHCAEHALTFWLAHPLTADDLSGLRAIYGY
jgi:hypothetical protein